MARRLGGSARGLAGSPGRRPASPGGCGPGTCETDVALTTSVTSRPGSRDAAIQAGALAGLAGLAVFLTIHQLWIVPIWSIAPLGGVIAAAGGAAVGAAYAELLPSLPSRPWTAVAVVGIVGAVLLPAFLIAEAVGPVFETRGMDDAVLIVPAEEAALIFVGGLLGSATLAGLAIGWLIGRSLRAAMSLAGAAFVFALGPGHNIPFLGGTPAVGTEIAIMALVVTTASVVMIESHHWLARRAGESAGPVGGSEASVHGPSR